MVPDVCGNVTVLSAPAPGGVVAGVAGALAQRSEALATVAEALVSDAESADPGDPGDPVAGAAAAGRSAFASGGAREPGTAFAQAVAPGTRTTTGGAVAWAPVGPVGSAPAAQASAPGIGKVLWQGLRSSTVPRAVSTVGLKRVADGLARSGETVRALATLPIDPDLPDDRPGARPGVVDVGGVTQTRDVPEPGSLACVLAALAAAWWVGRRRALRQAAQR
jgi:hypothetical protein